jgi:glycosyltransferase involved in cell wall biosynthesis
MLDAADRWTGCLGNVQTVVSVSDAVASSLEHKPGPYRAKRRTIHNALPPRLEQLLATLAGRAPRRATRRLVIAMGRLAPEKNYPMLIRAAAHMPTVSIAVIGAGPDEAMLQALARALGVADRVAFLGQMPREQALARLADGDLFVQVSLFEGHSLALIEAAQLGMPLIVSDAPSQIEGITASDGTRCGIIVGSDDAPALAREILCLLDQPSAYAHWAARARQLAAGVTYDAMISAYLELAAAC